MQLQDPDERTFYEHLAIDDGLSVKRLTRIDAPPRDTPEGAQGRRYVAHIFYAFNNRGIEHTFTNGRYLNQELVDKGFAKVV